MCVLKFDLTHTLRFGEDLVSSWFISPLGVNLVLFASHCDEHCTVVGCKAGPSLHASYSGM